jgi:hypothetical protein
VVDVTGELQPVLTPIPVEKIRKGLAMYVLQKSKTLHASEVEVREMVERGSLKKSVT